MFTMLRLDLDAIGKDLLAVFMWIRAHMSLVQTKTMNMVLTANPITVITKLIPEEIILQKKFPNWCNFRFQKKIPQLKSEPQWTLTDTANNTLSGFQRRIWSGFEAVAPKMHAFLGGYEGGGWIREWWCERVRIGTVVLSQWHREWKP